MVKAASGGVMWGQGSWHTLATLAPNEHHLTTTYLSIIAHYIYSFMATVYWCSVGCFQKDNAPCHNVKCHLKLVS